MDTAINAKLLTARALKCEWEWLWKPCLLLSEMDKEKHISTYTQSH